MGVKNSNCVSKKSIKLIVQNMAGEIFVHACHILIFLVNLRSSLTQKNLFPLSWYGERAYSKSEAPTEIGNQTMRTLHFSEPAHNEISLHTPNILTIQKRLVLGS